jgi:hypothetical protein
MRELIILRSAYLLDCPYEWQANILMAKNTGCTQEQIDAMTSEAPPPGLDDKTALVILATDEITKSGTLTDAKIAASAGHIRRCHLPQIHPDHRLVQPASPVPEQLPRSARNRRQAGQPHLAAGLI